MAFATSLSLQPSLPLSSPSSSSSSSCSETLSSSYLLGGTRLNFSPYTHSGKFSHSRKHLVVFARRRSGLEEAALIMKERESKKDKTKRLPRLKRGKVSRFLSVPEEIQRPPYVGSNVLPELSSEHQIHDSEGIARMKASCELAARVLDYAGTLVKVYDPDALPRLTLSGLPTGRH